MAGLLLLAPAVDRAALGGDRSSVDADRRALGGTSRRPSEGRGYTVERFDLDGTKVREYVRRDGRVFAVAWEGLAQPDLGTLLGPHAAGWRAARATSQPSPSRARRRIVVGDLVVETWGHMRHLRGRALDRALLPPEVAEDAID